jgi:D-lyxose ketol-isomerase
MTLFNLGATVPVADANETMPAGVYVELQPGRSVEKKLSFRFQA